MPDRNVLLIFGLTGMGKSFWTHRFLASQHRVAIMDPQDEYREFQRYDDIGECIEAMTKPVFRVRHSFPANFRWLCKAVRSADVGRCWLVIEEANLVMPLHRDLPPQDFLDVIYRGRHQEVSVLLVAQRPSTVNIAARSQWDHIITFCQTERADVQWMEEVTGQTLPLRELQRGEYLRISRAEGGYARKMLELPPLQRRMPVVEAQPSTPQEEETQ